jgi:transmembrane sensor
MSKDQRIILLISLKLNGEATPEELMELETFINDDPELLERIENMKQVWKHLGGRSTGLAEQSFEKHLHKLNNEVFAPDVLPQTSPAVQKLSPIRTLLYKKKFRLFWGAAAASILLFWFIFRTSEPTGIKPINNTVSTKAGDKANITLPDGSKVWLNGDSKITYNDDFRNNIREVHLFGEAFFEVAKDKTKPFIIHTRMINLKVLGTAFNVRSYDYEKETETSLVHGSVEITLRNSPDQKILLKPGEKLLVKNIPVDTSSEYKMQKPDEEAHIAVLTNMHYYGTDSSNVETSWTKNQLEFNDEPLDKIALNLERWFNVQITIANEGLKKQRYTATLEEKDKLGEFLEALKLADGFHYSIKNREVVISR